MKLSLKIMTALFLFAVIGITSCSKNQFGLDVEKNVFSETIGGTDMQHELKVKQITSILETQKGVKIVNNYTDSKIDMTGTLYEFVDFEGKTQRVVKVDKESIDMAKDWYPAIYTVTAIPDGNGGYKIVCTGAADDCFGWKDTTWWIC